MSPRRARGPQAKVKVEAEAKTQDEGEGEGEREADLKVEAGAETGAEARTPGCICLGLGSPAASRDARAQLAFLLEACDALELDRGAIPVFDPVFSDEDHALLSELGLQPTAEDKQARYALEDTTLAYMPHCDLQLYENLLRANWTRAALPRVVLIANRLSEYADSMPSRRLSAEYPCVARIGARPAVSRLTVQPLPPWPAHPTAFNNTAVQYARADALAQPPEDWWALPAAAPSPAPE
ncbi:hypothetical protein CERSUDRAFT_94134 [Gelatoporia subvermispora B]|uniref:SRR1-like domain-containing protein n=1 Tax=Ceriporiopsis subvermispora (strain B) TaxID=914234 RepID=M2RJF5_CERS8|nr:hypothetical protein CERSUDRAFT_94134 [Gelatoporia subvermispora B]